MSSGLHKLQDILFKGGTLTGIHIACYWIALKVCKNQNHLQHLLRIYVKRYRRALRWLIDIQLKVVKKLFHYWRMFKEKDVWYLQLDLNLTSMKVASKPDLLTESTGLLHNCSKLKTTKAVNTDSKVLIIDYMKSIILIVHWQETKNRRLEDKFR